MTSDSPSYRGKQDEMMPGALNHSSRYRISTDKTFHLDAERLHDLDISPFTPGRESSGCATRSNEGCFDSHAPSLRELSSCWAKTTQFRPQ